jgi:histidinol dehydrogenase
MIRIMDYASCGDDIFIRDELYTDDVSDTVAEIIRNVRAYGDEALFKYTKSFDKAELKSLEVDASEIKSAYDNADSEFANVLVQAKNNIRAFHENQKRCGFAITGHGGSVMGQRVIPLEKVGIYVPGGTAAYPSSVLMNCIPAKIAGVDEVIMVTPPSENGKVPDAILAAAYVAGVDRVFAIGGAQAVAALAYGTQSVPRVDKIVGPGNRFVAEAKKQVFGKVAIDMIAGPSEILVIADGASDPKNVAADLLSQAEHDRNATAVLVTDNYELANNVRDELERQIPLLPRAEIARESIDKNGKIIIADSLDRAVEISNRLAPEHLEICTDEPFGFLDKIRNAGSVFLGRYCPEALGDYMAGPNHTLPTSGTARFSSPLSVDDFVKKSQFSYFTKQSLEPLYKSVALFARKEGLSAHARSAEIRFEGDDNE